MSMRPLPVTLPMTRRPLTPLSDVAEDHSRGCGSKKDLTARIFVAAAAVWAGPLFGKTPPAQAIARCSIASFASLVTAGAGHNEAPEGAWWLGVAMPDRGSSGRKQSPEARYVAASVGSTESRLHAHAANDGVVSRVDLVVVTRALPRDDCVTATLAAPSTLS